MLIEDVETVRIFDTTLRDGEQSPGASLSANEKVEIGRLLARMGVDVIEAGFPAASPADRRAVARVAREVGCDGGHPVPSICALARTVDADIDIAWAAVRDAEHPRIHTFLAASDLHLEHKLRITRDEALARAREAVARARSYCASVQFSPEDASRADPSFLCELVAVAAEAGATTINIPDTVGYALPDEFARLIERVLSGMPRDGSVIVSVHCHDDLGLASANTLAGLLAGARQAEVTVNGIGERAGNTAIEEIVMALSTRRDACRLATAIDTTRIAQTSRIVSHYTGIPVQPNKAIVGANAFSHESGIHQDGVLKHQATYEIMQPASIGWSDTRLVLGRHSGRHAFGRQITDLGYELTPIQLEKAFLRFKELAGKKRQVSDADVEALIADFVHRSDGAYRLVDLQVVAGRPGLSTATVRLRAPDRRERVQASIGTGPVDAIYRAIHAIVDVPNRLEEFRIHAVTEGIDAQGAVSVRIGCDGTNSRIGGYGADTDILVASARAYLDALNRLIDRRAASSPSDEAGSDDRKTAAKEHRMNERGTTPPTGPNTYPLDAHPEPVPQPWHDDPDEIRGWALHWDDTALRKASLARKMRELRESGG